MSIITFTDIETNKFWSRVEKQEDGHWIFRGKKSEHYKTGIFWLSGKTMPAKMVCWVLSGGAIPWRHTLIQTCENDACINPEHLKIVKFPFNHSGRKKMYTDAERKKRASARQQKWQDKNREHYREYQKLYHRKYYHNKKLDKVNNNK